jgi:hypothetical protein
MPGGGGQNSPLNVKIPILNNVFLFEGQLQSVQKPVYIVQWVNDKG